MSHERARRAELGTDPDGDRVVSRRELNASRSQGLVPVMQAAETLDAGDGDETDEDETEWRAEQNCALEEVADISFEHVSAPVLDEVDYERDKGDGEQAPAAGVKAVNGKETYVVEDDAELFRGRDELWHVLEQESAAGSDEFEDEDAEEMARRIKDLEDLRGDWLPEDDDDDDFRAGKDSDSACSDELEPRPRIPRPRMQACRIKQRMKAIRIKLPPASTPPSAGSAVPAETVRAQPEESGQSAVPGPPNGAGGSKPALLYTWNRLKSKTLLDLKDICRSHGLAVSGTKDELMKRLTRLQPGSKTTAAAAAADQ